MGTGYMVQIITLLESTRLEKRENDETGFGYALMMLLALEY